MTLRTVALLALSCLLLACSSSDNKGECVGTFLGQPVKWAMDAEGSDLLLGSSPRYGTLSRSATLLYTQNETDRFGLEVDLDPYSYVDETNGPRVVTFTGSHLGLEVEDEAVVGLHGLVGNARGFGTGFQEPPGEPKEGTLRIERLVNSRGETRFAGSFVHRYEDGGELTCSFDVRP